MLTVFCRTSFEGFHSWPAAPGQVSYLRARHRHVFHVRVDVPVMHGDRDVEFITLKHRVDEWIRTEAGASRSCEQWAEAIGKAFNAVAVEVSEDNENGATWRRSTE